MRNGSPVLLGAGRVIQTDGAISLLGGEAALWGKRALLVVGKTTWEKFGDRIEKSLEEAGVEQKLHLFSGYCSDANTDAIAAEAKKMNAELVIAVGGGRCVDTGKWSANKIGLRCITVPTSAATCAAYVSLCVLYDDTGSTLKSVFTDNEVAAMIVDTDIITKECPPRMFASGIADALAKFPEMDFSMLYATNWERSVLPSLGVMLSKFNTENYYAGGLAALEDVKQGKTTALVEDILATNIMLTGMISCLASGGKQIAIAHSVYDCVCTLFKEQRKKYLHGEIVSCGIAVQMGINGYPEEQITNTVAYLQKLETPTKLTELDIEPNEENLNKIYGYIITSMEIETPELQEKIRKNLQRIAH